MTSKRAAICPGISTALSGSPATFLTQMLVDVPIATTSPRSRITD
jgi:hypothetical protein